MRNDTYLVKVVNTTFAPIVILDDYWLSLPFHAHIRRAVFCAHQEHIFATSGDIGDESVGEREGERRRQDRSPSCLEQSRRKLRLVFPNRSN